MQDDQKKLKIPYILKKALLVTVFSFLVGCSEKDADENGIEELQLSGETKMKEAQSDAEQTGGEVLENTGDATVFVYVCGAVNKPGVYELDKDARVYEAIQSAGGITEHAAPDVVNQARVIEDGEQIYVPTEDEAAQGAGVGENAVTRGTDSKKVNINTAGEEELMTLTGIGEAKAASILKYREENGRFKSIEELMQIEGIKEGVFNKIKDDITI